ncbi:MAG: hypothetical protein AUH96_12890 [Nitrospirae bacterium 13_2_20CM_2_61_4]|nr:MAG: hypothetical protein AUH96_12890 [Nitrospirae bacterium 13_2_20CM_2_61_4]
MKDHSESPKAIEPDDPSIAPLLTFDKSLAGKMAGESDVGQVLDQARRWLGTRLVTQLNILFILMNSSCKSPLKPFPFSRSSWKLSIREELGGSR